MRKLIGWLLFAFGFPLSLLAMTVSKEITGHFTIGIFIGILIISGGWFLAHPKRRTQ